jgi:hypothetical protein
MLQLVTLHAFYRGVFRDWMLSVCATIPSLFKKELKERPLGESKAPYGMRPEFALTQQAANKSSTGCPQWYLPINLAVSLRNH